MADFSGGGAERVMVNIANGLCEHGYEVDMMVARAEGPYTSALRPGICVRPLARRLAYCVVALAKYLQRNRPAVVLAAGEHACAVAVLARQISWVRLRLVLSLHNAVYKGIAARTQGTKYRFDPLLVRTFYRSADRIVTVSNDLRRESMRLIGGDPSKFVTIYNPLFSSDVTERAKSPTDHHWFVLGNTPVILAVGRLISQKGFDNLLRAFALVRLRLDAHLIVLGEGPDRAALTNLASSLEVRESVDFAGFVSNPYAYMRCASVVVMSSRYEGFGNVLVEAMAVGTPVVSTNCPHGPREILADGKYGALVPIDDPEALAEAILNTIAVPPPRSELIQRARMFSVDNAVRLYEEVMGLVAPLGQSQS
jgi:glycosyltransferase involved in cell wall biosynthesis